VYVYAHTKEGLKIEMMRTNPMVCFEVDVMESMSNWRSVIAWGKFEEIKKPEERKAGMQKLIDRIMPLMTSETTPHHAMVEAHAKDVGNMPAKKSEAEDAAKNVAGIKAVVEKIEVKFGTTYGKKNDNEIADEIVQWV
jgi:nitroimidazol reductase NimA-like FMN-containing flavoprotein (pyridoxamine 5'-phosphate oxidase superfamily)